MKVLIKLIEKFHKKYYQHFLLYISCLFILGILIRSIIQGKFSIDFETFYLQAVGIINSYDLKTVRGTMLNLNLTPLSPPTHLIITLPLGLMPFDIAKYVFLLFNSILLITTLVLLGRKSQKKFSLVFFTLTCLPIIETLIVGQLGLLLLFSLTIFFLNINSNESIASMGLAFAISIKLTPIVILIPLLFYKRAMLPKIFLRVFVIQFLTLWIVGIDYFSYYYIDLLPSAAKNATCHLFNQSLLSAAVCSVNSLWPTIPNQYIKFAIMSPFFISSIFILASKPFATNPEIFYIKAFCILIITSLLNSITWPNHLTYIILIYAFFLNKYNENSKMLFFLTLFNIFAILLYNRQITNIEILDIWLNKAYALILLVSLLYLKLYKNIGSVSES